MCSGDEAACWRFRQSPLGLFECSDYSWCKIGTALCEHITYAAMKEFAQTKELGMRILMNCDEFNCYPPCKIGRFQTTRLYLSAGAKANYTYDVNLQLCGLSPQKRRIITAQMLHITVRVCLLPLKYPYTLGSSQFLQDIDQSLQGRLATFPLPIV